MNRNHDMNELKKKYLDKEMSTQQLDAMKNAIEKAKKDQEKNNKVIVYRRWMTTAVIKDVAGEALIEEESMEQKEEMLKKSMEEINAEIQAITEPFIDEFKGNLEREEGYQSLGVESEIIHTTEDYFTLKLICYTAEGSSAEWYYYYTLDLNTGKRLQLKDIFTEGSDYVTPISENIISQMRKNMAEDEMKTYWLDDEIEELNFKAIKEDQSFYLDAEGNVVISFNEGDVAPMYMGVVEFTIPNEVISDIRVN